jgi:predicted CopG family antitoxin
MDKTKFRVISVSIDNYNRLQRMGFAGESFNDQLNKIFQANNIPEEERENVVIAADVDKKEDED